MPPTFRPAGALSRRDANRTYDQRRGSARERGYSSRWDKASAGHLRNNPLCRYCELAGDLTPATLTDHLYPHRGNSGLFWNSAYWIASCKPCHDGFKQGVERQGRAALDKLARRLGLDPLLP